MIDDDWLRGVWVGSAGTLALLCFADALAIAFSDHPRPGSLVAASGSRRSRAVRAGLGTVLFSAAVLVVSIAERPWGQIAFLAAVTLVPPLLRGPNSRNTGSRASSSRAGSRDHGAGARRPGSAADPGREGPEPLPPDAPRTSSDPTQRQQPSRSGQPPAV